MWYITYCNGYRCVTWINDTMRVLYDTLNTCLIAANEVVVLMDASAWCERVSP